MAQNTPVSANRLERILAYMVASAIVLSLAAFLAVIIGTSAGVRDFTEGVWPTVVVLPIVGLPIGFILIVILLVLSMIRRSREAKDAGR